MPIFRRPLRLAGSIAIVSALAFAQTTAPSFRDYPVTGRFTGKPAKPRLVTAYQHTYRTQIRRQAKQGPNFAGHFTIAKWGCGSPCLGFVIIDTASGVIYEAGFSVGCADKNGLEAKLGFKLSSSLVTATGVSRAGVCGTDLYQWDGAKLSKLGFVPWSNPPE